MCEIYCSVAWQCDDKDCAQQWHQANYWIDGRGYTVDQYGDGNHEKVTKREIPSNTAVQKSWHEYARFVLATGTDPLDSYYVKHARQINERWRFCLHDSILGVMLIELRQGRRKVSPFTELPSYVREYLNLAPGHHALLQDFKTLDEARAAGVKITRLGWTEATIVVPRPRSLAIVARELRAAARGHLATSD